jgi:hypothetical protein
MELKDFSSGWSYREQMDSARQTSADAVRSMRTRAGEEIAAELIDALVAEAERGYDLSQAKRRKTPESVSPLKRQTGDAGS